MDSEPVAATASSASFRLGMAAVVIMAAGFGWVGGNFSTATDSSPVKVAITLGHLIFPVALAVLAGMLIASPASAIARRGVSVVAWLSVAFVVASTGYALANPDQDAFGPHNFADYTAIVILLFGAMAWLLRRFIPRTATALWRRDPPRHPSPVQRTRAN